MNRSMGPYICVISICFHVSIFAFGITINFLYSQSFATHFFIDFNVNVSNLKPTSSPACRMSVSRETSLKRCLGDIELGSSQ